MGRAKRKSGIKKTADERVFQIIVTTFLVVVFVIIAFPMWKILLQSFTPGIQAKQIAYGLFVPPSELGLQGYQQLIENPAFPQAAGNSFFIFFSGVFLSLSLTLLLSYALSIKSLPGRKFLLGFVLVPFLFTPGLIPEYLVITGLGLQHNGNPDWVKLLTVVLPGCISVYNVFVMKSFFEALPEELKEAARMDGASEMYILFRVILPLSKPIILTIGLFYGVYFWNDFFNAILYINDSKLEPLPILLRNILLGANFNEYIETNAISDASVQSIKAASVFLTTLPMLIAYPWIQRYFTKGTLMGGIKG